MNLRFERHPTQTEIDAEFKNIIEIIGNETWATRAPNASDKGQKWIYYTASAMTIYYKNPISGTWFSEALS